FMFTDPPRSELSTLSLHDALPISFFGWGLALLRMIPIDRAKGRDAVDQVIRVGQERLKEGRWPLLFPEGTRIAPGKAGRYKMGGDRKSTRLNSSHVKSSYAVFCLK